MVKTFDELRTWANALPNDQIAGLPHAKSYVEFEQSALARPDDQAAVEAFVAGRMHDFLRAYLASASLGPIYWRTPLECVKSAYSLVVEHRNDGPDTDPMTGERCVIDPDWIIIKAYCRLFCETGGSEAPATNGKASHVNA